MIQSLVDWVVSVTADVALLRLYFAQPVDAQRATSRTNKVAYRILNLDGFRGVSFIRDVSVIFFFQILELLSSPEIFLIA